VKVLHIIPTLGVGGAERQLVKLLPRMDRSRFEQTVCYYTPSRNFERDLNTAGIRTIFFDKFSMPLWRFFRRLRQTVREVDPDIVHTWLYSGNFWGRLAALSCGVTRLIASDRSLARPFSAPVYLYERMFARYTVRLANSRAVAASLERRCGLPADRTRVIHNAVDAMAPEPGNPRGGVRETLGLPPEQRLVLMVGRQAEEKNHPMFLRAARRCGSRRPDVTFVALGHLFRPAEMDALVDSLGARPFVRIVEQREDVGSWLAAADVFCLTSDREGMPNVVLEAMAAGLPIVCADFESCREVLSNPEVGIIVPRGDDVALAEAVLALLDDPERRRRLGEAARAHARAAFGWDRLVREMEALYSEIAGADLREGAAS
jgi:glycosyltransferase involved in cell wall biosynthesis